MSHGHGNIPLCTEREAHHEVIDKISLPDDEHLFDLAEFFSVMGDSTRIKILYLLFEGELCVCDISEKLSMTMSAISHQLRILKNARLVKYRKSGKSVFYSLDDEHIKTIINMGNEHINEMFGGNV
ncbi:MAG: helix-turn-helix transcriptional regulator [Ruminococcaceae bacterium]|nr:helix-turn-helix transcriptional regulator [Oscillospiraceae bacterium]